jgi:hypothetical protein
MSSKAVSRKVMIVENDPAVGPELRDAVELEMRRGPVEFKLVVPASPPAAPLMWTEGEAHEIAESRLAEALDYFERMGAEIEGWVGNPSPISSIEQALERERFDSVIFSGPARGLLGWLRQDLAARATRLFRIQVLQVAGSKSMLRNLPAWQ